MAQHLLNFKEDIEKIWTKRFGPKSVGYGKFTEWVCSKLIGLEEEKYDLDTLLKIREDTRINIKREQDRLDKLEKKIKVSRKLEDFKYKISKREAAFLNDSKELIAMDPSKLYPRIKSYASLFNKEVNEEEFLKLMDLAYEKYPLSENYVEEIEKKEK